MITSFGSYGLYIFCPLVGSITDKYGPKVTAFLGAILTSLGYGLMGFTVSGDFGEGGKHYGFMTFYYLLCGLGSACSYSAGLSTVVKNAPSHLIGLFSGLGVAFFAISGVVFTAAKRFLFNEVEQLGSFFFFLAAIIAIIDLLCVPFVQVYPQSAQADAISSNNPEDDEVAVTTQVANYSRWEFVKHPGFWYLLFNFTVIAGAGMMYIIKVGSIVQALSFGDSGKQSNLAAMHASILSIGNFSGRLLSGIITDWAKQMFGVNRVYFLALSATLMALGHGSLIFIEDPTSLFLATVVVSIAYGFTFAITPALICDWFSRTNYAFKW
jgi:MFS family permease